MILNRPPTRLSKLCSSPYYCIWRTLLLKHLIAFAKACELDVVESRVVSTCLWFFHSGLDSHDAVVARTGPCVPIAPAGPVTNQRLFAVAALAVQIVGRRVVAENLGRFNAKLTRCYVAARLANKSATPISPSEIRKNSLIKAGRDFSNSTKIPV
jgi:hypothetical protein